MPANVIQANYETLDEIARLFNQNAAMIEQTLWRIRDMVEALASDGWWGEGADAFYAEMEDEVLPQVHRLKAALEDSADVTFRVSELLQKAEEEAANGFQGHEAIITPQGLTEADYGGGGSGEYTVSYNYDPTKRPGGIFFFKRHQVRPYPGIINQFNALDAYVQAGNSLPQYSFIDYFGTHVDRDARINARISSRLHPEAYLQNEDGSLQLDDAGNPIPNPNVTIDNLQITSFNVGDDGNICGPMTVAVVANAMLRLRGNDLIHPGQALSDLVSAWSDDGKKVNIFRDGDNALLGQAVRDPSDPTFIMDMSRLGSIYGLESKYETINELTTEDVITFFETELGEGRVPMVLVNIDSNGIVAQEPNPGALTNHYVAATSIQTASDGQTWLEIYNPYNNRMEYYHIEDFQAAFVNGKNTAISFTNPNYQLPENAQPINLADWNIVDDPINIPNRGGGVPQ